MGISIDLVDSLPVIRNRIHKAISEELNKRVSKKATQVKYKLKPGEMVIVNGNKVGQETGTILKLNRTRAVVDIDGIKWNSDKWNPSDVWIIYDENIPKFNHLREINLYLYKSIINNEGIVGLSLKKGDGKLEEINFTKTKLNISSFKILLEDLKCRKF